MKFFCYTFLCILFFFSSCETDFDVNAEWRENMVVYALLDATQQKQFIRINKAYLGDGDAFQMASIADSINYPYSDLEVKIYKIQPQNLFKLDSIFLDSFSVNKDNGLFAAENHYVYSTNESDSSFFDTEKLYSILITNLSTGYSVSSTTGLVKKSSFTNIPAVISPQIPYKFNFYNPNYSDSAKFLIRPVNWNNFISGQIYQLDLVFNYIENGLDTLCVKWEQPVVSSSSIILEGESFFNFLKNNIPQNNSVREFLSIDLVLTVGSLDLANYIAINSPTTSLVQQRPVFTNIDNGIGLFSSRSTTIVEGIGLNEMTMSYLSDELDRNFN